MTSLLIIFLTGALINNIILSQRLGLRTFFGSSRQIEASAVLGGAVILILTITSGMANLLNTFVLAPLGLESLQTFACFLVIAILVQVIGIGLKNFAPEHQDMGDFLYLLTANCVVLGAALTNMIKEFRFLESLLAGFCSALGYVIVIILMTGIRERMESSEVPAPFQGAPILLLSAALMAMAFYGLSNLVF